MALLLGSGLIADLAGTVSSVSAAKSGRVTSSEVAKSNPRKQSVRPKEQPSGCISRQSSRPKRSPNCGKIQLLAASAEEDSSETTLPAPSPQDVYKDICVPMNWTNCGEYEIFNATGNLVNRVIANSDWTNQYIAALSGGGADGSSLKIKDVYPL